MTSEIWACGSLGVGIKWSYFEVCVTLTIGGWPMLTNNSKNFEASRKVWISMCYEYAMGAFWLHTLVVEKIFNVLGRQQSMLYLGIRNVQALVLCWYHCSQIEVVIGLEAQGRGGCHPNKFPLSSSLTEMGSCKPSPLVNAAISVVATIRRHEFCRMHKTRISSCC